MATNPNQYSKQRALTSIYKNIYDKNDQFIRVDNVGSALTMLREIASNTDTLEIKHPM